MEAVDGSETATVTFSETTNRSPALWLFGTMIFWVVMYHSCHSIAVFLEQCCCGRKSVKLNFTRLTSTFVVLWCCAVRHLLKTMEHQFTDAQKTIGVKKCYWRRLVRSQVYYMGATVFGIYLVSQYPLVEYFWLEMVCGRVSASFTP